MKRSITIFVLIAAACICLWPYSLVYADAQEPAQDSTEAEDGHTVISYGNILYKDDGGLVEIRAEDFVFLEEKLSSVPEGAFDPAAFSEPEDISTASVSCIQEVSFGDIANAEDEEKSGWEAAAATNETADAEAIGDGQEGHEEKMEDADETEGDAIDITEDQEDGAMPEPETDAEDSTETDDRTETGNEGDTGSTPEADNGADAGEGSGDSTDPSDTGETEGTDSVSSNSIGE